MRFTKMHGAGNDFVIINNISGDIPEKDYPRLAQKLCAYHTSIGADGLMMVVKAENGGDYGMRFYNSDGSLGEMCGNGARCIARYGYENSLAGEMQMIETTAGLVTGERLSRRIYKVRLNDPTVIEPKKEVSIDGREIELGYIELGNPGIPHVVVLLPDMDEWDRDTLRELGRKLRFYPEFPKGANVNFVKQIGENELKIMTYERGVEDFTLACGTGSGSVAAICHLLGLVSDRNIKLQNAGGELSVDLKRDNNRIFDIYLSGPTNIVCEGEILDEDLN